MVPDDVGLWLERLGLAEYVTVFDEHPVDADVLSELTNADLEKTGIKLGHRKKLLKAITALPASGAPPRAPSSSSLPATTGAAGSELPAWQRNPGERKLGRGGTKPHFMTVTARIRKRQGADAEAEQLADQAVAISRETGVQYTGARAMAMLALASRSEGARRCALREGEALLAQGAIASNVFEFHVDAMQVNLDLGDWAGVDRHADALEAFTRSEPLPWMDFHIAKGRVLANRGRGGDGVEIAKEIARLRNEARRAGFSAGIVE